MLKHLGVSRSGFNAWKKRLPSEREKRKEAIKEKIQVIYNKSHQNYGAPKITNELNKSGEKISERTVGKYMLSVENRNSIDNRTIGGFFYDICDELQDINFTTSLMFLLDTLKQVLSEYSLISESLALEIIDNFFNRLPSIWKHKLQSCA